MILAIGYVKQWPIMEFSSYAMSVQLRFNNISIKHTAAHLKAIRKQWPTDRIWQVYSCTAMALANKFLNDGYPNLKQQPAV